MEVKKFNVGCNLFWFQESTGDVDVDLTQIIEPLNK